MSKYEISTSPEGQTDRQAMINKIVEGMHYLSDVQLDGVLHIVRARQDGESKGVDNG